MIHSDIAFDRKKNPNTSIEKQFVVWLFIARRLFKPLKINNITYFIFILLIMIYSSFSEAFASPVVSIPSELTISNNSIIDIPILISNVSGYEIGGYILRLDYSDHLSNPVVISDGTLSQDKIVKSGPPSDGLGGKLAIGLMSDFYPEKDGTMLIVRLNILPDFKSSDICFLLIKSRLHTASFQEINAKFINGYIYSQKNSIDINKDQKVNLIDVMMLFKYLSN